MKKAVLYLALSLCAFALFAEPPEFLNGWELPDCATLGEICLQSFIDAGAETMSSTTRGSVTTITEVRLDGRRYSFSDDGTLIQQQSKEGITGILE